MVMQTNKQSMSKNVVERMILKIETLKRSEPDYFINLFTELELLATYKSMDEKDKKESLEALESLENLWNNTAVMDNGEDILLNLGEAQSYFNFLRGTSHGRHKIEKLLIDTEIQMKVIYFALTKDYDVDFIKRGLENMNKAERGRDFA